MKAVQLKTRTVTAVCTASNNDHTVVVAWRRVAGFLGRKAVQFLRQNREVAVPNVIKTGLNCYFIRPWMTLSRLRSNEVTKRKLADLQYIRTIDVYTSTFVDSYWTDLCTVLRMSDTKCRRRTPEPVPPRKFVQRGTLRSATTQTNSCTTNGHFPTPTPLCSGLDWLGLLDSLGVGEKVILRLTNILESDPLFRCKESGGAENFSSKRVPEI